MMCKLDFGGPLTADSTLVAGRYTSPSLGARPRATSVHLMGLFVVSPMDHCIFHTGDRPPLSNKQWMGTERVKKLQCSTLDLDPG